MDIKEKVLRHLAILAALLATGIIGFRLTEGWSFLKALYCTVITITTVGYGDITPMTRNGRIFAIFLVLTGAGAVLYIFTSITQSIIEGEFQEIVGRRRMERTIGELKDHYIICGFGKTGSQICHELALRGQKFLVLDNDRDKLERALRDGFLVLQGDATLESVLEEAGIAKAKGIAAITGSDATNVFIVLTARGMNRALFIISRFEDEETENKLKRAGADRAVSPHHIGGLRMASMLLKPNVCDFVELATTSTHLDLQMEEVILGANSRFTDKTVQESSIRKELGVIIAALKKKGQTKFIFNPRADEVLQAGDLLIVIGRPEEITKLREEG